MIDEDYCVQMARYNAWQNGQLFAFLMDLSETEAHRDRGAFFGSILGTLNHVLWGDGLWMSRFDGGAGPSTPGKQSHEATDSVADWIEARQLMDRRISTWAESLDRARLAQDLTWWSGMTGQEMSKPLALCVAHFFNHQTHHRGQVHAMLTAAGSKAPVTDLVFMPDDTG